VILIWPILRRTRTIRISIDLWWGVFGDLLTISSSKKFHSLGGVIPGQNERKAPPLVKLDRNLCTADWEALYPGCILQSQETEISDHCPLVLGLTEGIHGKQRFHFESFWTKLPGFHDVAGRGFLEWANLRPAILPPWAIRDQLEQCVRAPSGPEHSQRSRCLQIPHDYLTYGCFLSDTGTLPDPVLCFLLSKEWTAGKVTPTSCLCFKGPR
jgi:hypothetical protein